MRYRVVKFGLAAVALVVVAAAATMAQTASSVPRTKDGKPNFTGIWQVMNTANWDVQAHSARMGPVVALGAAFSIPAGVGVVDGDEIPYTAGGAEAEAGEPGQLADARPRDQVLHAGHPAGDLHALPVPDRPVDRHRADGVRVRQRQPRHPDEQPGEESGAGVDGMVARAVGRRHAGRRRHRSHGGDLVRSRRELPQRCAQGHRALHLVDANTINYEATIEDPKVFTRPWKMRMPIYRHREPNAQLMEYKCVEFAEEVDVRPPAQATHDEIVGELSELESW